MAEKQNYGIKFPFSNENNDKTYIDLNESYEDGIKSQLLHIVMTPKGQKLRDPEFGTNLIKFIFEPNDEKTLEEIEDEIKSSVRRYLNNVSFDKIEIFDYDKNGYSKVISMFYTIKKGNLEIKKNTLVKI